MAPRRKKKKTDEAIKPKSDNESSEDQQGAEEELEVPKITQEEQDEAAALLEEQQQQQQQQPQEKRDDVKLPAKEESKLVSFDLSIVRFKIKRRQDERLEQVRVLEENQAAAATAATNSTSPDIRASKSTARLKGAPRLPLAESLEREAAMNLSAKELAFVNYYKASVDHVITPKIPKEGFSSKEIMRQLENRSQKYCIMIYYQEAIHLFHSAFMVGELVFACKSRTGIDGDSYVQFHFSEFTNQMICLEDWDIFMGIDENKVFPSALELVKFKNRQDLLLFSEDNKLWEFPVEVAKKVSCPPAIMLVTGRYSTPWLHYMATQATGQVRIRATILV